MFNILLIGSGNIGSRHLQGIIKSKIPFNIYIVEKSKKAIILTKKRIKEISKKKEKIFFFNNFNFTNVKFDLLICATNSNKRYELLRKVISYYQFKYILIEKVVFQNLKYFEKILKILYKNKIKSWVNCPRREQTIYINIKNKIKFSNNLSIKISGKKWNIASNSIHFFDLYNFIRKNKILFKIEYNNLKKINSKHKGFSELTGKIKFTNDKDKIIFDDSLTSKDIIVEIKDKNYLILINETKEYFIINKKNMKIKKKIKLLKQSELTSHIVKKLYYGRKLNLPTLRESFHSHKQLFKSIGKLFYKRNKIINCPIT